MGRLHNLAYRAAVDTALFSYICETQIPDLPEHLSYVLLSESRLARRQLANLALVFV